MWFKALLTILSISLLLACPAICMQSPPSDPKARQAGTAVSKAYSVEITIRGKRLTVFEINGNAERVTVAEYTVGTVVKGLDTYPLGMGTVTGIELNPWWYPTPYTREVFRKRGIELPAAVPPGDPLNYMGQVKISLSHKTWKGAIYRIHGNNNPKRVGRRVTGGCFVMSNEDGIALARMIRVGTEVNIVP